MTTLRADPLPLTRDAAGVIRIGDTRVSLESLVVFYQAGASVRELAEAFPDLSLPDLHATIAYYLKHREEVDHYLDDRRLEAEAAEARLREEFPRIHRRVAPSRRRESPDGEQ